MLVNYKDQSFPVIYRFKDIAKSTKTLLLDMDYKVFGKILKKGTIVRIVGYRDIDSKIFLVISKGTWESLLDLSKVKHLLF